MAWHAFSWNEIHAKAPRVPAEALSLLHVFLTPFAAMEAALGMWRLGDDLGWTGPFFINHGILSHWQVWFALAAFSQIASVYLNDLLAKDSEIPGKRN